MSNHSPRTSQSMPSTPQKPKLPPIQSYISPPYHHPINLAKASTKKNIFESPEQKGSTSREELPLWEKVKLVMDNESLYRHKVSELKIKSTSLKRDLDALKEQLTTAERSLTEQKRRDARLVSRLHETKCNLNAERKRTAEYESQAKKHHDMLAIAEEYAFKARKYRTALAAAFKLLDDLSAQTTLAHLLEKTEEQLKGRRKSFNEDFERRFGSLPEEKAEVGTQSPVKCESGDAPSDEDAPMAKKRRLRAGVHRHPNMVLVTRKCTVPQESLH